MAQHTSTPVNFAFAYCQLAATFLFSYLFFIWPRCAAARIVSATQSQRRARALERHQILQPTHHHAANQNFSFFEQDQFSFSLSPLAPLSYARRRSPKLNRSWVEKLIE